jgi:trk system potassium uptake protein TrkH
MGVRDGLFVVGVSWVVLSLFGMLPFILSGAIPHPVDAFFETVSGFTTTGATVLGEAVGTLPEDLDRGIALWRALTHWIGGMGVLAFVLIFIPESNDGSSMHLLRAESPGPQVGKLVSKMKMTTRILYLIYFCMTVIVAILLLCDKPIQGYEQDHVYLSVVTSLGCAGTGGFSVIPGSMELFNPFSQCVVAIALIFFGINFGLYYLILIGQVRGVLRSEELKSYFFIIIVAVGLCFLSLLGCFGSLQQTYTTEEAFRHSLFQVVSLMTTAGYSTTDFNLWPMIGRTTLVLVMFIGGMAGSTAGGMKVSRIVMAFKGAYINVRKLINPRYVPKAKFEGKTLEKNVIDDVFAFVTLYFFILMFVTLLLAFDPINGTSTTIISDAGTYTIEHGFFSNFSTTVSCMSNIGPAFEAVGPYASFAGYSMFSKVILTFTMLLGRLEILPVLILFNKRTWATI